MSLLRGILFDNLGLKLVALLLAVLVYLHVYTDRPAAMLITFPIHITDLADSLSLVGPTPSSVRVELRGRAKQLIRLRVTEPPVKVSLAGVRPGRFERALGVEDLPLPEGVELQVDRMVSPRVVELQVDRRSRRVLPVSVRLEGEPASGAARVGPIEVRPRRVVLIGPASALAELDSVVLSPVSLAGRRDTVRASVLAEALPEWTTMEPQRVEVIAPIGRVAARAAADSVAARRSGS